ncbi:MAG: NIPSNAP family protein [Chitinophagaceae bacterium]|nr:MAG: NIPSNAP family protein [Chitinophagaceae bacterium]
MKISLLLIAITAPLLLAAQKTDTRYYELRVYYCHPGRLDALLERFTNHTTKLFEKHGMENVGYWLPLNNTENALYYVLAYPSKSARDSSWKAFSSDTVWRAVAAKSEESGKIVAKVTSTFMEAAGISPAIKPSVGKTDRVFELRTYYISAGRQDELLNRFRNHSLRLLSKQGIEHIAYWTTVPLADQPQKLVYIVAYPTEDAGKKSWDGFRKDPDWIKAKAESEKDHPLVDKVESVWLKPVSFSKIK